MTSFVGKAKVQAAEILLYAALSGGAALVRASTGEVDLSVGDWGDRATHRYVADPGALARNQARFVDADTVVGAVGTRHLLVVKADEPLVSHGALLARVERACGLLGEMLRRSSDGQPTAG